MVISYLEGNCLSTGQNNLYVQVCEELKKGVREPEQTRTQPWSVRELARSDRTASSVTPPIMQIIFYNFFQFCCNVTKEKRYFLWK
ncbi:hypothetical protein ET847_22625 [Salmonella enterica subsp. enterica serovar Johannesburg]|nr:hypothetical protein [Salmonella enterica subsp. enterica serovar Johannesburg]